MNKLQTVLGRRSLVSVLSLGFIVLGIGCCSLAMFNIVVQSNYTALPEHPTMSVTVEPSSFFVLAAQTRMFIAKYTTNGIKVEPTPSPTTLSPTPSAPDKPLYPIYPAEGDTIGSLTIPAINKKLPVIEGTSTNELKKGVGHFLQSVLPGEDDNCVLSGHRDSVFTNIGKLKIGDELIVQTSAGTFTYVISRIRIVHKDDKTVIVPTDHAVLTLTTCYPFNFFGSAPDRYILIADLVESK